MLELIKELKSKEDSFRSYVKVEVLNLLDKIIASNKIKKTTKEKLTTLKLEFEKIPFDYRHPHNGNQDSHDLMNSYIKMILFVLDKKIDYTTII